MAARISGSVTSGKSTMRSIGRSPRACHTCSYSFWTWSEVGCAGRSMPNCRKHASALSTACVFSVFRMCRSIFRR